MTRTRRVEVLGAVLLAAVVVLVVALSLRSSSGGSVQHPSGSARPAALAFGRSYLAYLSGVGSASALVDATSRVRTLAAGGGTLPPRVRSPRLRLTVLRLSAVAGAPRGTAVLAGSNGRVSLKAALGLAYVDGRWSVVSLVPPDLDTVLARAAPVTAGAALRRAARRFVLAYADYREHAGRRPRGLAAPAARQLSARTDPLARVSATAMPARLRSLAIVPQGTLASATARLTDHGRSLRVEVVLRRSGAGWRAWAFPRREG